MPTLLTDAEQLQLAQDTHHWTGKCCPRGLLDAYTEPHAQAPIWTICFGKLPWRACGKAFAMKR